MEAGLVAALQRPGERGRVPRGGSFARTNISFRLGFRLKAEIISVVCFKDVPSITTSKFLLARLMARLV